MSAEPSWLTIEEQDAWLSLARVLMRIPAVLGAQLQSDSQITHFEYVVLSVLSDAPGRTLRMSELAQVSDASLSRLSQVVGKLEQRGWVARNRCPNDRRSILATLTDEGMALVVQAAPGHVDAVRRYVIDPLDVDQREALKDACLTLIAAAEPDGKWHPGLARHQSGVTYGRL